MAIVNISMPDQMKLYIKERIGEGGYNTTSEYFRDLVREDQKKHADKKLAAKLILRLKNL